jgi:radical SAM protein with 4Fe4S-binding SPASM domain
MRFDLAPLRVYWETTRACGLACRHCRAEASPNAHPRELTPKEGRRLLDQLAVFGEPKPHLILTGGDPLERADLFDLISYARSLGFDVSVSPSATPRLTPNVIRRLASAGVAAASLSIDGSTSARHDTLRGVPGCFDRTVAAAHAAYDASLMLQINTLVSAETVDDMPAIHSLATALRVARWSMFFLVSVGRAAVLRPIGAARAEHLLEWAAHLPSGGDHPIVTTTEAPHFRRILLSRRRDCHGFGVRDGNGVMFISHTGNVSPSGFLPRHVGNVRTDDPVDLYRHAPLFVSLREANTLHGRCGACPFRWVCGGSRARAWCASGDPLGEDPSARTSPRRRAVPACRNSPPDSLGPYRGRMDVVRRRRRTRTGPPPLQ